MARLIACLGRYTRHNCTTRFETRTKEFNWITSRRVIHILILTRRSESNIVILICARSGDTVRSTRWVCIYVETFRVNAYTLYFYRTRITQAFNEYILLRPERWWTMLGYGEVRWKLDGSLRCAELTCKSLPPDLSIGAKDSSNHLVAGSLRSFPQDSSSQIYTLCVAHQG